MLVLLIPFIHLDDVVPRFLYLVLAALQLLLPFKHLA